MDVLTPIKKNVIDPSLAIGSGTLEGMKDTFTTKKGASDVAYMVVGGIAAGIVTIGILPRIPFGKLPFGREIASATTPVSYTHFRSHVSRCKLVCLLLLD